MHLLAASIVLLSVVVGGAEAASTIKPDLVADVPVETFGAPIENQLQRDAVEKQREAFVKHVASSNAKEVSKIFSSTAQTFLPKTDELGSVGVNHKIGLSHVFFFFKKQMTPARTLPSAHSLILTMETLRFGSRFAEHGMETGQYALAVRRGAKGAAVETDKGTYVIHWEYSRSADKFFINLFALFKEA